MNFKFIVLVCLMVALLLVAGTASAQGSGQTVTTRRGNEIPVELGCLGIILAGASAYWVYSDANSRGGPGCLWALVVYFIFWPLGFIAYWLFFRPDPDNNQDDYEDRKKKYQMPYKD